MAWVDQSAKGRTAAAVRAVVIDKDQAPVWQPASIEALDPAAVEAHFAPLGATELVLGRPA